MLTKLLSDIFTVVENRDEANWKLLQTIPQREDVNELLTLISTSELLMNNYPSKRSTRCKAKRYYKTTTAEYKKSSDNVVFDEKKRNFINYLPDLRWAFFGNPICGLKFTVVSNFIPHMVVTLD